MYDWEFNHFAEKQFSKLDASVRRRILAWLNENIAGTDNPRLHGKALTGDHAGLWRYRVGQYRLVAKIKSNRCIVVVVTSGKHGNIYHINK